MTMWGESLVGERGLLLGVAEQGVCGCVVSLSISAGAFLGGRRGGLFLVTL
jgi:hypothetical protein